MTEKAPPTWTPNDADILEAFPPVDCGVDAFGERIIVQIRTPKRKSKGGIILHDETRETELWNTQVAKVISIGKAAFKNRDTLEKWPEGDWCQAGEFVRVPKHGGDRWQVEIPGSDETALFVMFKDHNLLGRQRSHPLYVKAFI